jgi:thiamine-phosphate pyrophosphorylase
MAPRDKQVDARPAPRFYLVTPQIEDGAVFVAPLGEALAAGDIAAVMLRLKDAEERSLINRIMALAPEVQGHGAALIVDGHVDLVARVGADGAHLTRIDAFNEAIESLKPERIAGCGGLGSRHDAMLAAEAGADYIMFGEPDTSGRRPAFAAIAERIAWWAEVFEVPCVGYAAALEEVAPLAAAGADFVALGDFVWRAPRAQVAAAVRQLSQPETAA